MRDRRGWIVLGAVAFANLVVAALHFGLAAAAPAVRRELELDTAMVGVLLAGPAVGLMVGTFGWGVLADRTSERRVLAGAFVGFALATWAAAGLADAGDEWGFALALLVSGAFGSAAHSAGGRAISAAFPAERHGLVLSIRHVAIPIGAAVGGVVVPAATERSGLEAPVLGAALAGLVAAIVLGLVVPSARSARMRAERAAVVVGASPLRLRTMRLLAVGAGSLAFVQLGVGSFLTIQLVDRAGLALVAAAAVFTVAQLLGAAGRVVLGIWSDRVGDRVELLRGVAIAAGALTVASAVAPSPLVAGALQALVLVIVTSCNGVVVAVAASLAPPGRTGATLGMQTTANAFACSIAPILLGVVLARVGWHAYTATLVVVLGASAVTLTRLQHRRPVHA